MPRIVKSRGGIRRASGPRPLHLQAWAEENKLNVGFAQPAQLVACLAEAVLHIIQELRKGRVQAKLPPPPSLATWLEYYDKPLDFYRRLGNKLLRPNFGSRVVAQHAELTAVVEVARNAPEQLRQAFQQMDPKKLRREIARGFRKARSDYRQHLAELRTDLEECYTQFRQDLTQQLERSPEMHFALTVFLPCVVHFQRTPAALLRAARYGDAAAIEDLLRLDARMTNEPSVERWLHRVRGDVRDGRRGMAGQWMRDGITRQLNTRTVKDSAAGLVSVLAVGIAYRVTASGSIQRYKVTAPQILELFHAAARDRGTAVLGRDPDLQGCGGESWSKTVQRHRKGWLALLGHQPDKS